MSADPAAKLAEIMQRVVGLPEGSRWLLTSFLTPSGEPDRDVSIVGDQEARRRLTQRERECFLAHLANWIARTERAEIERDRAGRLEVAAHLLRQAADLAFEWANDERTNERKRTGN